MAWPHRDKRALALRGRCGSKRDYSETIPLTVGPNLGRLRLGSPTQTPRRFANTDSERCRHDGEEHPQDRQLDPELAPVVAVSLDRKNGVPNAQDADDEQESPPADDEPQHARSDENDEHEDVAAAHATTR